MKKEDNPIILSQDTIIEFYKEFCIENEIEYTESSVTDFIEFLKIDIYDWMEENAKYFSFQK